MKSGDSGSVDLNGLKRYALSHSSTARTPALSVAFWSSGIALRGGIISPKDFAMEVCVCLGEFSIWVDSGGQDLFLLLAPPEMIASRFPLLHRPRDFWLPGMLLSAKKCISGRTSFPRLLSVGAKRSCVAQCISRPGPPSLQLV